MTYQFDLIDRIILQRLQENARINYKALADETRKSMGTISNRIQKLLAEGVIKDFSIITDPERIGYDLTAIINIQIDVKHLDFINQELKKIEDLFAIYNITGDYDILAIGRFLSRTHLDQTIHRIISIPHIQRTSTTIALRTLKEDFRVHIPIEGWDV